MGKGQNVKNHFVESKKKNIESQKEHQKSERRKSPLKLKTFDVLISFDFPDLITSSKVKSQLA
jgi:hypothetical protein